MPRVLNRRLHGIPEDAVYIGRPSKWGNPFVIGKPMTGVDPSPMTREQAIACYRLWLWSRKDLLAQLDELLGKDLVCHCAPLACHGDVLLSAVAWKQSESTGTAVDEVYDFEVETEDGLSHTCCPVCGGTDLVMRKGRWQCEPCEEHIFQSGF